MFITVRTGKDPSQSRLLFGQSTVMTSGVRDGIVRRSGGVCMFITVRTCNTSYPCERTLSGAVTNGL